MELYQKQAREKFEAVVRGGMTLEPVEEGWFGPIKPLALVDACGPDILIEEALPAAKDHIAEAEVVIDAFEDMGEQAGAKMLEIILQQAAAEGLVAIRPSAWLIFNAYPERVSVRVRVAGVTEMPKVSDEPDED